MKAAISAFVFMFLMFSLSGSAYAAEYFVSIEGSDQHDGRSWDAAFATVQQGVNALDTGDALTIAPGEYRESVEREDLGNDEEQTIIRAQIPGTVLLRGDVPAPAFEPVDGYRFVYRAAFDREVQAVNERDTLRILESVPDISELEFAPGGFHYDPQEGMLYISTTDLQPPAEHEYTLSVIEGRGGIFLKNARNVVVDGLAATGFHSSTSLPRMRGGSSSSDGIPHGFFLWRSENSVVRNCTAFFNAGGITVLSAGHNTIEDCTAFANYSQHGGSAGNIVVMSVHHDTIRNCHAYRGGNHGIRMYGAGEDPVALIEGNISWGHRGADFQTKGGDLNQLGKVVRSIAPSGSMIARQATYSLMTTGNDHPSNILLDEEENLDLNREFADPQNLDFRLQADSRFRNAGPEGADKGPFPYEPNVFYVTPHGDDNADGLSIENAWKSLEHALNKLPPGSTLYVEGDANTNDTVLSVENDDENMPIRIRGRGTSPASITGALSIRQSHNIEFERINFTEGILIGDSSNLRFNNCQFTGSGSSIRAERVDGLRITHSIFSHFTTSALQAKDSSNVFLQSNIFDNTEGTAAEADQADTMLYSDYNGYSQSEQVWRIGGEELSLQQVQSEHDRYSNVITPEFEEEDQRLSLRNQASLATKGAFAGPLGVHRKFTELEHVLRLAGPFVHSVTDTTANIEWWVSGPTDIGLEWGTSMAMENTATSQTHRAGSFSLTGLEPDTDHYLRLTLDEPLELLDSAPAVETRDDSVVISFTTAAEASEPQTYYVATDGDDNNAGLSRGEAWRTITHAAGQVHPDDTVRIAGGTYTESVRIRTTGEEGQPITFKALAGEKVILDGGGRTLDCAFYITNKSHLRFDGFYLYDFNHGSSNMPWSDEAGGNNGSFVLHGGDDIHITRCFHGRRTSGYIPGLLAATHSSNVMVRNCVITASMGGGISFYGCPDIRIENNVFLRNLIQHVSEAVNEPDQMIYMKNNIFTDNIPSKVTGSMFAVGKIESLVEKNNCYYLRLPKEERKMFMFYEPFAYERAARAYRVGVEFDEPPVIKERVQWSLPEYQQNDNPESGSIAANPRFKGAREMEGTDEAGDPLYVADRLAGKEGLDFPDLFATNPEVVERGIGLDPEAFEDFHFEK